MVSYILTIRQSLNKVFNSTQPTWVGPQSIHDVLAVALAFLAPNVSIARIPNSSSRLYTRPLDSPSTNTYTVEKSSIPRDYLSTFYLSLQNALAEFARLVF
eukprot:c37696_g1_i1 orf=56-358(-)